MTRSARELMMQAFRMAREAGKAARAGSLLLLCLGQAAPAVTGQAGRPPATAERQSARQPKAPAPLTVQTLGRPGAGYSFAGLAGAVQGMPLYAASRQAARRSYRW
jgi:hypothetical protein